MYNVVAMKAKIHPKVKRDTKVTCTCGAEFTTISTVNDIHLEVCSNCHPFYTGEEKLVDTEGRVDKFKRKQEIAQKARKEAIKKAKAKKSTETTSSRPTSLKDMLKAARSGK